MPKKTHLTIEVYDEDAVMRESIGGPMGFDDVRATMISILKNDGIPVVRQLGKHAADESDGKHAAKEAKPCQAWEQPLSVSIVYDNVRLAATGKYEDVMDAQAEFLKAIFEDE